jgi:beta-galactosidase
MRLPQIAASCRLPIEKYQKHPSLQLTSYDIIAPPWAYAPDVEFDAQDKLPNVLGEFVWTGFDYLGEPTPYFLGGGANQSDWPARSSYFGVVDLAGFPKDRYYLYQSLWTRDPLFTCCRTGTGQAARAATFR